MQVRNNKVPRGEFLKNRKNCLKDGVRRRIDLNVRTSYTSSLFSEHVEEALV